MLLFLLSIAHTCIYLLYTHIHIHTQERKEAEFRSLFAKAGLKLLSIESTKGPMVLMILEVCDDENA